MGLNNASNLSTIKQNNRSLVLRLLNSYGSMSRAELARSTGLTKTSITNIINDLINEGLINETGTAESQSGRKPTMLNLYEDAFYALGLYISRDFAYSNIVNLKGKIIYECKHIFDLTENEQTFISIICQKINEVLTESKIDNDKILGLGIASIGPLDIKNGIILDPPNFRGLKSIYIVKELSSRFNLPVYMENDMKASAIAEKLFGKAKNISNFLYVGVTNGIGAGIIINDEIFRGANGFAGEIGHITIDIDGERCSCGNIGCLELYAGIPNTVKQVKTSIGNGAVSELSKSEEITWKKITSAAKNGDKLCIKVIDNLAYYLSIGLVNTINSFDTEVVFMGHDIAIAEELIIRPLNELVNRNTLFRSTNQVSIELSAFREYSPCIGAPSIILNRFFKGEIV